MTNADMVAEFHGATRVRGASKPVSFPGAELFRLRRKLILEEFREYRIAAATSEDPADVFKELCDLLYVVYGTALTHGFTPAQIDAAFAEVHRSNMTKVDGMVTRPDGKILKGANYEPARIAEVLGLDA